MKTDNETGRSDHQSLKPRRPKSREISSRFLSSTSNPVAEIGIPSPSHASSPLRTKPRSSTDNRKQRSLEDSGLARGLWPSSTQTNTTSQKLDTLADHLGNERLKDLITGQNHNEDFENPMSLNRQSSCTELSRFEKSEKTAKIAKENHKPLFGGSMRYTGNLLFPRRSSTSSSSSSSKQAPVVQDEIAPGRFSVDENALRRRSFALSHSLSESESDCSDVSSFGSSVTGHKSPASYMNSTASSRKYGVEVSSKYKNSNPASLENFPRKSTVKNMMKKANSLRVTSKWGLSPGRSPPVENRGRTASSSNLKPPTSPSRVKGVGNLLSMGFDLFRGKKVSGTDGTGSSGLGPGGAESVHGLRLVHNRLVQWRFGTAKAEAVNLKLTNQAKSNLVNAWTSLTKLQHSVLQKKLQLEKEKLEMKLNFILHSQIKSLEAWGDMERQHLSAISMTKDCLHSVICRVPLVEGAKMEPHSASVALRHASDLTTSIKSMLYSLSPTAEKTVIILSELAEVVTQEKALMEELLELLRIISILEIEERSLKCSIIQMRLWKQQQQHHHHQHREMAS